ncbi:MAG: sigma-70 family RNA polymerase sigma factor [Oscillospiraceae bacterium]|nr:sigma-70 family RNA polymerase sigma factor [Oscillospiraceae bacterium]
MNDQEMIRLFWERNENAISEASAKYGHYCSGIAMNILNNREDAEECVNEAYLQAWNSIPPQKPKILSAFLGRIVRNLSFNRYKQRHSAKRGGHEIPLILDELAEIIPDRNSVEDEVFRRELKQCVDRFLDALPEEKRYLFLRRYWYSDSVTSIAEKLGRSADSVSVELHRIRKRLRDDLAERGYI